MNTIVYPRVPDSEKHAVKDFINIVESSFNKIDTEHKLEKQLKKADLLTEFDQCVVFKDEKAESELIVMPISFQIKKFFEVPGVFEKIIENTTKIQQQPKISNFIHGTLWKEKLKNYKPDDIVIPYFFYCDAAQVNHPLGPHCVKGSEEFNYYAFPTIPTEYQSRLENIFVAALFPGNIE